MIFDIKQHGWKELSQFLQLDIPKEFNMQNNLPRVNTTQDMVNEMNSVLLVLKIIDFTLVAVAVVFVAWIVCFVLF